MLLKGNLLEDKECRLKVYMMYFVIDLFFLICLSSLPFKESRFFDLFNAFTPIISALQTPETGLPLVPGQPGIWSETLSKEITK